MLALSLLGLGAETTPYSKSHSRRMKRKVRESLITSMGDVKQAIDDLEEEEEVQETIAPSKPPVNTMDTDDSAGTTKVKLKRGQIGESKGSTLSAAQRKRIL